MAFIETNGFLFSLVNFLGVACLINGVTLFFCIVGAVYLSGAFVQ